MLIPRIKKNYLELTAQPNFDRDDVIPNPATGIRSTHDLFYYLDNFVKTGEHFDY